jgi:hypothetical protein
MQNSGSSINAESSTTMNKTYCTSVANFRAIIVNTIIILSKSNRAAVPTLFQFLMLISKGVRQEKAEGLAFIKRLRHLLHLLRLSMPVCSWTISFWCRGDVAGN